MRASKVRGGKKREPTITPTARTMGYESSTSSTLIAATIVTSVALAYISLSKKAMATKEKAIAAAGELKLPAGFVVSSFANRRSQTLHTVHLPRKDESTPPKAMLFLAHGIAEHCEF